MLEHTGDRSDLDVLPNSPFRNPQDPPTQHIVDLDELPRMAAPIQLVAVAAYDGAWQAAGAVEFGPLGETTTPPPSMIWLGAGDGLTRRYVAVWINPVTGLAEIAADESGPLFTVAGPQDVVWKNWLESTLESE